MEIEFCTDFFAMSTKAIHTELETVMITVLAHATIGLDRTEAWEAMKELLPKQYDSPLLQGLFSAERDRALLAEKARYN